MWPTSFFRGAGRWSLATGLALALLAGKGFEACRGWAWLRSSLVGFVALALAAPLLVVLGLELALATPSTQPGAGASANWNLVLNSISVERVFTETGAAVRADRVGANALQNKQNHRRPVAPGERGGMPLGD